MNRISKLLPWAILALGIIYLITPAAADTTISFSNLAGLQGNQLYQVYNSTGQLVGEINSSAELQHSITVPDGQAYMIIQKPEINNVYLTNPVMSIEYLKGLVPIAISLLPYLAVLAFCCGILFLAWRRGWI